jgi:hypothetical protein
MARKGAAPKKKMNRNVFLNLVLAAFSGLADSIWSGTVFVAYLYKLADGSNTKVGITAAVQGLSSLITALPAGWVSAAPCSRPCSVALPLAFPQTLTAPHLNVVTQAADKYTRSGVIKVGAVTQLIFILAMFAATLGDGRLSIDMQVPSITRP